MKKAIFELFTSKTCTINQLVTITKSLVDLNQIVDHYRSNVMRLDKKTIGYEINVEGFKLYIKTMFKRKPRIISEWVN